LSVTWRPSAPLAWNIQISPEPSERSATKWRRAKMYWPSGDHDGLFTHQRFSCDTGFAFLPSGSIVQMFHSPSRSLVKAMRLPSGLKRGCMSNMDPLVMRVAVPPAAGIV
jgi:hypothetical protein